MRHFLNAAVLTTILASGAVGCHDQRDISKTNRLNSATSSGNSQQATEPPTNFNGTATTSPSTMQP